MHYYQFNIGDYLIDTQHLELMEDLAYRRMLDLYYQEEGPLPLDVDYLAKKLRMRSHVECIKSVLSEFFTLEDDGYHNRGADKVLNKIYEKSEKAKRSAEARWNKNKELKEKECDGNANALQTQCDGNATQYPIPNTQYNTYTSNSSKSDRMDYKAVQEIWNRCLTNASTITVMTDKRKRIVKRLFNQFELNLTKWENYLTYLNSSEKCKWMFESRDKGNGQKWQPKGFEYIASEDCYLKVKEQY